MASIPRDTGPAAVSINDLPVHVLELIVDVLVAHDTSKRPNLFSFSLVSRACRAATELQRSRYIPLVVHSEEELRRDVQRWEETLRASDRLRNVRILKISGRMSLGGPADVFGRPARAAEADEQHDQAPFDPCAPPRRPIDFSRLRLARWEEQQAGRYLEAWSPLAALIAKLPGLTDLVHACADQLSPNILDALHQHRPACRLHMHTFHLRSFVQYEVWMSPIDPNEIKLAMSPCLYSIALPDMQWVVQYPLPDIPVMDSYTFDLVPVMVGGLSPNLTKVHFYRDPEDDLRVMKYMYGRRLLRLIGMRRARVEAFLPPGEEEAALKRGGRPRELSIPVCEWPHRQLSFFYWSLRAPSIDWHHLESLAILGDPGIHCMAHLAEMGAEDKLPSLKSLSLAFGAEDDSVAEVDQRISLVLRSLPPLRALSLDGWLGEVAYDAVLECGLSLRKLVFVPHDAQIPLMKKDLIVLHPARVQALREKLVMLEELTVGAASVETQWPRRITYGEYHP